MSGIIGGAGSKSGVIGPKTFTDTPSFWATGDTNLVNPAYNVYHDVPHNVEIFDNGSNYNNSTYTFTAPVTGVYHFSAHLKIMDPSVAHVNMYFFIILTYANIPALANQPRAEMDITSLGSEPEHFGIMDINFDTKMDKGDTAKTQLRHTYNGAGVKIEADNSWFSGHLIR